MDLSKVSIRTIANSVHRGAIQITEVSIARRDAILKEVKAIEKEIAKAAKKAAKEEPK